MSNQIKGVIKLVNPAVQVNDKFKKREFVLTDNSTQYPQDILIQCSQDRCALLDTIKPGDEVTAHINIRGREWKSPTGEVKYFNTIEAWKIEASGNAQEDDIPVSTAAPKDDLPF